MLSKSFKPVEWVGSSYKDFVAFPNEVQDTMGHALYLAQTGRKHMSAKPLKGFGGQALSNLSRTTAMEPTARSTR